MIVLEVVANIKNNPTNSFGLFLFRCLLLYGITDKQYVKMTIPGF